MIQKSFLQGVPNICKNTIELNPYDLSCINLAHDILSRDPTPKIIIEHLAKEIGINRNKLHYGFKQVYGSTIHEFMEQQRMQKAELLLLTTQKPIKAIASLICYSTSSRFGVVFKKNFGLTPYQYRKKTKYSSAV